MKETSKTKLHNREKLLLLLWKDGSELKNKRLRIVLLCLLPVLFFVIFVLLRFLIDVKSVPTTMYVPTDLHSPWQDLLLEFSKRKQIISNIHANFTSNHFVPRFILGMAPNEKPFENILSEVSQRLNNVQISGFSTCQTLRENIMVNHYIAGVCFNDNISKTNRSASKRLYGIYPNQLNYSLIFPRELRNYTDTFIGSNWNTKNLFEFRGQIESRLGHSSYGNFLRYIREGFISLQNAVSMSYLQLSSKRNDLPEITMELFPLPPHDYDELTEGTVINWSLCLLVGFAYPVVSFTRYMVEEKEKRLKAIISAMGVSNWLQFCCWFIQGTIITCLSSFLVLMLLMIPWHGGYAIINRSSFSPIIFFLFSYNITSICFCFMMSTFFTQATTATVVTGLLWLASYLPYIITTFIEDPTIYSQLLVCMFSNTVMAYGLDNIFSFEYHSNGFDWNSYFKSCTINEELSLGECTVILYVLSIIYTCVGLYACELEQSPYGIPYKWQRKINKSAKKELPHILKGDTAQKTLTHETDPISKRLAVEIVNLTKQYDGDEVIRDISMNLFEDEITVLMGHNGSGKTTLISMIMGLIPATSGVVYINTFDVQTEREDATADVSICMDNAVLFDDLTVVDQLTFFGRLKGTSKPDTEYAVERYLKAMEMEDMKYVLTRSLTVGLRKCLAVCCALIGGSKIILLDDPSAGMDLLARKLLWQLLEDEKHGRTIVITTNSTDEADVLADRVAMISGGELRCYGSTFFLKRNQSRNYRLICVIGPLCNVKSVTTLVRRHIPYIAPECIVGNELVYILEAGYTDIFPKLFDDLENNSYALDLQTFSICTLGMNYLFLKFGAEHPSRGKRKRHLEILNGQSIYAEEYKQLRFLGAQKRSATFSLFLGHWRALLKKQYIFDIRNSVLAVIQILAPALITYLSFVLSPNGEEHKNLIPMTFALTQYPESITVVDARSPLSVLSEDINNKYREIVSVLGDEHKLDDTKGEAFASYILKKYSSTPPDVHMKYFVGMTIGLEGIIAWFNNYPLHSAPLSLNLVHNAMARAILDDSARITVTLEPLPHINQHFVKYDRPTTNFAYFFTINLTFYIFFIWTLSVLFLSKEHQCRFKLVQFISGVHVRTFWTTTFVYHLLKIFIMTVVLAITTTTFNHYFFAHTHVTALYFFILILFGICIFPLNYLLSTFFKNPLSAYGVVTFFNLVGGTIAWVYIEIVAKYDYESLNVASILEPLLEVFPHFTLCNALTKICNIAETLQMCADRNIRIISTDLEKCNMKPKCCPETGLDSWALNVLPEITYLTIIGTVSWLLLCLIENRALWRSRIKSCQIPDDRRSSSLYDHKLRHGVSRAHEGEEEVIYEQVKITNLRPQDIPNKTLICDAVNKTFGKATAIHRFSLIVERSECVGFLGVNGSGKTILLKLLTGDEKLSFGRVFVEGIGLKDDLCRMYERIGYCPQEDAILPEYTGREAMTIFCLLRGVPRSEVNEVCRSLAKVLGFFPHYNKLIRDYSRGIKRRLSCAIAMLGNPSIIYLDDPTSSIDPAGRRQLWNIMNKLRTNGKTLVFTSLNTRECERLCTRLTVISQGRLLCIGTPSEIKSKFWKGYVLRVKIKRMTLSELPSTFDIHVDLILRLTTFVKAEFPDSKLRDHSKNNLVYFIPFENYAISQIFSKLQTNVINLHIEQFSITRQTLSTIFLDLAEKEQRLSKKDSQVKH